MVLDALPLGSVGTVLVAVLVLVLTFGSLLAAGAVYVLDGAAMSYTSLSDRHAEGILTVHDVKVHVLGRGDRFNLLTRRPLPH